MSEAEKSKGRLTEELEGLRRRIAELEVSEARLKATSVMARESEDRYQTILERLEEGYYELDRKGNLISFNESLCRMFGYPRDELLGMNYRFIERLGQSNLDSVQLACVRTLKSNLENIVSPFLRNIGLDHFNLTPQEIHIANLVKDGRTTKEIAALLNLSSRTVEFHRANLRMKLDLKNKKSNLRSYLLSIS